MSCYPIVVLHLTFELSPDGGGAGKSDKPPQTEPETVLDDPETEGPDICTRFIATHRS